MTFPFWGTISSGVRPSLFLDSTCDASDLLFMYCSSRSKAEFKYFSKRCEWSRERRWINGAVGREVREGSPMPRNARVDVSVSSRLLEGGGHGTLGSGWSGIVFRPDPRGCGSACPSWHQQKEKPGSFQISERLDVETSPWLRGSGLFSACARCPPSFWRRRCYKVACFTFSRCPCT